LRIERSLDAAHHIDRVAELVDKEADLAEPYTVLAGVQVALDDLANSRADAKGRKAQEFVNEEILRELDKQGFFRSLQKK